MPGQAFLNCKHNKDTVLVHKAGLLLKLKKNKQKNPKTQLLSPSKYTYIEQKRTMMQDVQFQFC